MTAREKKLVQELRGKVCRCGAAKQESESFCRDCYFSLPQPNRSALYRKVGKGYEEAYDAAVNILDGRGAKC